MQTGNADRPPLVTRFKAAVILAGHTVTSWARESGHHASEVWMTLSGARPYPDIRDKIAAFMGITREEVDSEIEAAMATTANATPTGEAA